MLDEDPSEKVIWYTISPEPPDAGTAVQPSSTFILLAPDVALEPSSCNPVGAGGGIGELVQTSPEGLAAKRVRLGWFAGPVTAVTGAPGVLLPPDGLVH